VLLHMWPEVLSDVTRFPTAKAVIDYIPVAKVVGLEPIPIGCISGFLWEKLLCQRSPIHE